MNLYSSTKATVLLYSTHAVVTMAELELLGLTTAVGGAIFGCAGTFGATTTEGGDG